MDQNKTVAQPAFSHKQGQRLVFIHACTIVLGQPPAAADHQRHFRVKPPFVYKMVLALERAGFIARMPEAARSIRLLVDPDILPTLMAGLRQTVKLPVPRH